MILSRKLFVPKFSPRRSFNLFAQIFQGYITKNLQIQQALKHDNHGLKNRDILQSRNRAYRLYESDHTTLFDFYFCSRTTVIFIMVFITRSRTVGGSQFHSIQITLLYKGVDNLADITKVFVLFS